MSSAVDGRPWLAELDGAAALAPMVPIPEPPPPKLRRLDVTAMLATPPPAVPYLAEPILVRGAVTMIAGREGQGKSMLALALAGAVGHGSTVAGIECQPGRVLVVDAENGEQEAHRRLHGLGVNADRLAYAEANGFDLGSDLAQLLALVLTEEPDLLILDSLRSLSPAMDENDSGDVEAVLGPLRALARAHNAAVLLLHHACKGQSGVYRGSTGIGAAVEIGFTLARADDDPRARTRRSLTCWKCRVAPEPEVRWIQLGRGEHGIELVDAAAFMPSASQNSTKVEDLAGRIIEHLTAHGLTGRADLVRALGIEDNGTTKRALKTACASGQVTRHEHGRYGPTDRDGQMVGQMDEQVTDRPSSLGGTGGRSSTGSAESPAAPAAQCDPTSRASIDPWDDQ